MDRERMLNVIEDYLTQENGGALIVDTQEKKVDWTTDSNAISHGEYVVVHSSSVKIVCECGDYHNSDCEICMEYAYSLLEKVEGILNERLTLSEFLKLAENQIEAKIEKDMESLGEYANASHILNKREQYNTLLTDVFDGADGITKDDALNIIDETLKVDEYTEYI